MSEIYCNTENLQILLNRVNNRYGNIMLPIANFDIGERSKALNAFVNAYKSIYNITVDYCNLVRQDLGAICNIINRFIETDSGLGQDISNSSYVANKVSVETSLNEHDCWKETIMEWNVPSFRVSFDDIDALMREFDNRFTGLRDSVNEYLGQVNLLAQTQSYKGEAAESVRIYLTEVNMNLAEAIALLGEELKELLAKYWLYYKDSVGEINSYVFDEDSMTDVKGYLENKYNELIGEAYDCDSIIRNSRYISVIQSLTLADSGDLFEKFLSLSTTLDSLIEGVREGDNQWEKVINAFISEQCELVAGQISTFRNRARSSVGEYVPGTCDSIEGFDTFMNWLDYISEQVGRNRENIDALYNCEANIADLAEEMQANREELINTIDGVVELSEALIMITLTVATMGNILPASGAVWGTVKNVFDTMFLLRQISNGLEGIDMLTTGKSSDEAVNLLTDTILNGNENAVLVYDLITATLGLIYVVGPQAQTLLNDLKVTNLAQAMGVPYDGANNFLEYLNILEANNSLTAEEVELLNTTIINNVINGEVDVVGVLNDLMQSEICSENLLNSAALLFETNLLQASSYYVGDLYNMTTVVEESFPLITDCSEAGCEITTGISSSTGLIVDIGISNIDTIYPGEISILQPVDVIIGSEGVSSINGIGESSGKSSEIDLPDLVPIDGHISDKKYLIDNWDRFTDEQIFQIAVDEDLIGNYDLITSKNAKSFFQIDKQTGKISMIWPSDGGMDLSTIHSMGDLSGQIVVSRAGKTSGKTLAIGGSEVTNSMRSVPSSSSSAVCGTMNVDKYKSICDALNTSDPNGALKALGYKDDICKSLIDDYNSYFGRTEINDIAGIIDNNVDVGYGFVGEAKEWIVGDVTMVGGAQQIDSVFSWDTMVKADIISNPHAITIGF